MASDSPMPKSSSIFLFVAETRLSRYFANLEKSISIIAFFLLTNVSESFSFPGICIFLLSKPYITYARYVFPVPLGPQKILKRLVRSNVPSFMAPKLFTFISIFDIYICYNNVIFMVFVYICSLFEWFAYLFQCFNYSSDIGFTEIEPFTAEALLAVCGV